MDKKQLQKILIAIAVLFIGGIYGYYKYLLKPLEAKQAVLDTELDKIKAEFQDAQVRASRLPRLEQEIRVLNSEILEMQKKLPQDKDVPGLIRLLAERMKFYGIQWKRLEPGTQTAKEYYVEHSYKIPFSSKYHSLARFLAEIGQMERIFATRISPLRPETSSQAGPSANVSTTLSGDITFLIYTSK